MRAAAVVALALLGVACADFQPQWVSPSSIVPYRNASHGNGVGTLYAVTAPGYTDGPIILADISGSHYEVGYLTTTLLAAEIAYNYDALMASLSPSPLLQGVLAVFMDWQYSSYLTKGLPTQFLQEQQGIADAAADLGTPIVADMINRGLAMASIATGDVNHDIYYLLVDELSSFGDAARAYLSASGMSVEEAVASLAASFKPLGRTCSMISAWGSRTVNGTLYTGRNLDWNADTGISKFKLVTLYTIPGAHPYVSVGFAGMTGALTGMSKAGLTVHETGNDNKLETLEGFAWSLRLRALMEQAGNLAEATSFWKSTNNTLGINHGVGSAADNAFLALETKAGYTAFFSANDPREADFEVNGTHYGFPVKEALWRTNHGYDPEFLKTVVGSIIPDSDSELRYMLIHDTILQYEATNTLIGDNEALNITAVPGDKGGETAKSFVTCGPGAASGSNIISATFVPATGVMYLAYEDGHADTHVPASCNNYVKLDLSKWW